MPEWIFLFLGSVKGLFLSSSLSTCFFKDHFYSHCFADDTYIYLPLKHNCVNNYIVPLLACLDEIKAGMSINLPNLNKKKTEIVVFRPVDLHTSPTNYFAPLTPFL